MLQTKLANFPWLAHVSRQLLSPLRVSRRRQQVRGHVDPEAAPAEVVDRRWILHFLEGYRLDPALNAK